MWKNNNSGRTRQNFQQAKRCDSKQTMRETSVVIFVYDNAPSHTAARTNEKFKNFRWELFGHKPYSPDMTPGDYFLVLYLKQWLGGPRFKSGEELKVRVDNWLNSQAASFFADGLNKLVQRYEKCSELNDD